MLTVNTNVASLQAQKNLSGAQSSLNRAIDHLSAGLRITTASDDAAGLQASMKLQGQIASYSAAAQSTQTAIAQVQTVEGYLNEVGTILTRLRQLVTGGQGASEEATQLNAELDRVDASGFKGTAPISATVDINGGAAIELDATGFDVDTTTLDTTTVAGIDAAIDTVSGYRAKAGATANVLQDALGSIQTAATNAAATNSSIIDVDVAEETSKLSRAQVLAQAGVAVLAQANQLPQMALKLLG